GQGTEEDIKLFTQHDPHWIPDNLPDGGKIMIFNNDAGIPDGRNYSSINIIEPDIDENDNYILNQGKFGPSEATWTYTGSPDTKFYSKNLSGSQRLPNGNTLMCEGAIGRFTEINPRKEKVWQYVNPTSLKGRISNQGETTNGNQVFRAERISKNHPALVGRDLTPKGYIEAGSDFICELFDSETSVENIDNLNVLINQYSDRIEIESVEMIRNIEIFNSIGAKIYDNNVTLQTNSISTTDFGTGVYFLKIHQNSKVSYRKLMIN
ncbi:MAG: T9SS type A sorting domain-containing protein, partial [Candidatus Kapaibacterium sp.]